MTARQHDRDEAERLYLATEAADLAPVTDEDRRAAREGNWFTKIHGSDAAFVMRNGGQRDE